MGRAADYAKEIGISVDPSDAEAFDSGRMDWNEYQHRQQRRAAPNPYSPEDIASGASKGSTATEAASGWDGRTSAQSSRTDEHGNSVAFDAPTQSSPRDAALQQVSQGYTSTPTATPQSFQQILMGQLGTLAQPVSPDDPALAPQFAAQRLASQREADRARAVAAARRGAQGLGDSGALETDIRGVDEARAERNLAFEGDTLANEMQDRRRALAALLGLGLQDENVDNALAQQGSQFDRGLAQDDDHFDANLGFNYAGLNQNQSQFEDRMGFDWTALEQSGNLQALLALLGAA